MTNRELVVKGIGKAAAPMAMEIEPEDINVSDTATVVWAIE